MRIFTIGRKDTDIVLQDPNKDVSRRHAELTLTDDGRFHLADCGSSNGTFIKRPRAGSTARWESLKQDYVTEEDTLRFGTSEITVRDLLRMIPPSREPQKSAEPAKRNLVARRHPETGSVIWEPER